jgi:hypothetical protein
MIAVLVPLASVGVALVHQDARRALAVGMNLRTLTPFDRSLVFADAMKMASEWRYEDEREARPRPLDAGRAAPPAADPVPLDAHGWPLPAPGRAAACRFLVGMRGHVPAGQYVVTWQGSGTVELLGATRTVSRAPGRLVAELDGVHGGEPGLRVRDVDPSDGVRDVRVWLPGLADGAATFHPLFLERLRPFEVLRFYQWMRVYSSSGSWTARTTPATARQGNAEGVAAEHMVALCNALGADPWFCVPYAADDAYVRALATLVHDSLRPGARVYVELSNEPWNLAFPTGRQVRAEARASGRRPMEVFGARARRVFELWREVFGADSGRLVRVAAGQLQDPGVARELAAALGDELDALAIGAYFDVRPDKHAVTAASTAAELLAAARADLAGRVLPRIAAHRALTDELAAARGRPLALLAYEGGQHVVARGAGGTLALDATLALQRDPGMLAAYRALLAGAREHGLELLVAFDFCGPRGAADTFSVLEHLDEPLETAVKYRALVEAAEERRAAR